MPKDKERSKDTYIYSLTELSDMFGIPRANVVRRLAGVKPFDHGGKVKKYRIADAAPRLVKPVNNDIEHVIMGMRPVDLPPRLQDAFWGGMLKRQQYEQNARNLWRTEDIIHAFGKIFMLFRNQVLLWVDTIERNARVTDEQREVLNNLVDGLMRSMRDEIQNLDIVTKSSIEDLDLGEE